MKIRAFFFAQWGSRTSALHLDADLVDRHPLGLQVCLQGRHKLAQFSGNRIGTGKQTPLPLFDGPGLHAGTQGHGQQALDGLHAIG